MKIFEPRMFVVYHEVDIEKFRKVVERAGAIKTIPVEKFLEIAESCNKDSVSQMVFLKRFTNDL